MEVGYSDDMRCPFCDKDNRCGIAAPADCWCMQVEIPSELLELVPAESRGRACICGECVAAFNAGDGVFNAS